MLCLYAALEQSGPFPLIRVNYQLVPHPEYVELPVGGGTQRHISALIAPLAWSLSWSGPLGRVQRLAHPGKCLIHNLRFAMQHIASYCYSLRWACVWRPKRFQARECRRTDAGNRVQNDC